MTTLTLVVDSKFQSPWALSAFVALEEKQLPYTLETVVLSKRETFGPAFGARTHRVPALRRGDFWLAESVAIAEYLAESFPFPAHPRLFPENLEQRAWCREWQHWLRSDFLALRQERPSSTLWGPRATTPLSAAAAEAAGKFLSALEPMVRDGRTTLFESWCIADVDVAVMVQRLNLNGFVVPAVVKVYAEVNWRRPSMLKWASLPR